MYVIKMFKSMLTGLFRMNEFENKEDFWNWYWEQIPNAKYPNETLLESWEAFKSTITLGSVRFYGGMWFKLHFGKKYFNYSWTFDKNGYFFKYDGCWWFSPTDGSFTYGRPCELTELANNNPLFI